MQLELDHFFILVDKQAQQAELLLELGLEESHSRVHPGQGTSNRCFKFSNTMLELLWLRDEDEAENGPGSDLRLPQRLNNEQASPFGFIFKRKVNTDTGLPFNGWSYQPDYFPAPMAFHVADNSNQLQEPLCIYVPFMEPADSGSESGLFKTVSHLVVHVPSKEALNFSQALIAVSSVEGLTVKTSTEHLLEVHFNSAKSQACHTASSPANRKDFRPDLPLIFHY
jgi:hypothetical protein